MSSCIEANQSNVISSHQELVDSRSDLLQINKNCENVCHDYNADDSTNVNDNGSYSCNDKKASNSDKLDFELPENQVIQQITSTTEKIKDPCSPHTIHLGDEEHNEDENSHVDVTLSIPDKNSSIEEKTKGTETVCFEPASTKSAFWDTKLEEQTEWEDQLEQRFGNETI